jgi:hypothetical protein
MDTIASALKKVTKKKKKAEKKFESVSATTLIKPAPTSKVAAEQALVDGAIRAQAVKDLPNASRGDRIRIKRLLAG